MPKKKRLTPMQGQTELFNFGSELLRSSDGKILKGQSLTWETRQKISEAHKGVSKTGLNQAGKGNFRCLEFTIVSPDGVVHNCRGIRAFAQENGLDECGLRSVLSGRSITCKGWRLENPRKPKNRIESERLEEYIRLYEDGWTFAEIANRFGFKSKNSIRQALIKIDVFVARPQHIRPSTERKSRLRRCIEAYESGLTIEQIAAKFGLDSSTVYHAMKRSGYQGFRSVEESRQVTLKSRYRKVCDAYRFGLSVPEIAEKFDISVSAVRRALKRENIELRPKTRQSTKVKADMYWRMYKLGYSLPEVAAHFSVSSSYVSQLFQKQGYKTRSASDSQKAKHRNKKVDILPAAVVKIQEG